MTSPPLTAERFSASHLVRATAGTLISAVAAVLVIRAIAVNVVTVPAAFTPMKVMSIVFLTVLGVLAAAAVCVVLNRRTADPVATFRRVVPIVLPLTFVPDVGIWVADAYQHTATASTVIPLMIMHVAVAALCLVLLPALGREARAGRSPVATRSA